MVMSALESDGSPAQAFQLGAVDYLKKPIALAVLRERVGTLIQNHLVEKPSPSPHGLFNGASGNLSESSTPRRHDSYYHANVEMAAARNSVSLVVIDDNPRSLEFVSGALARENVNILTTSAPEEGIDLVYTHHRKLS